MARIQKVKWILTENLIPDKAEFGTVFVCKDTQQVWITARNGDVLNLSDMLEGKTAVVRQTGPQGPPGRDGRDAEPHKCDDALVEVHRLRNELTLVRAEIESLRTTLKQVLDHNTRAGEYVAWLQARIAERKKQKV